MGHRALAEAVVREEDIQVKRTGSSRSTEEARLCMVARPDLVLSPHVLLLDAAEPVAGRQGMAMGLASWMRLEAVVRWVVAHY